MGLCYGHLSLEERCSSAVRVHAMHVRGGAAPGAAHQGFAGDSSFVDVAMLRMSVVKMIERDDIVRRGAGIFRVVLVLHEKPATHCGHDFDGPDCLDSRFRLDIHNAHCSFRS